MCPWPDVPSVSTVAHRMGIVEAVRKSFHGLLVLVFVLGLFLVASRLSVHPVP